MAHVPEGFGVPSCVLFPPCLALCPGAVAFPHHRVVIFGLGTPGLVPCVVWPVPDLWHCVLQWVIITQGQAGDRERVLCVPVSQEVREEDVTGFRRSRGTKVAPRGWAPSPRRAPSPGTPCQSPGLGIFGIFPKKAASSCPVASPARAGDTSGARWAPGTSSPSLPQHPEVLTGPQDCRGGWQELVNH